MKWGRWAALAVLTVLASVVMVRWSLRAQDEGFRPTRIFQVPPQLTGGVPEAREPAHLPPPGGVSVGDALLRPFDFPFDEPTTLADVQKHLAKTLGVAIVLDLAALKRLDVEPDDTVKLDLKGVRLKTGLKLLLDQVGMTYRVVAEDNLLILTDPAEAGEPIERALRELKALHLELHDLRDAVDDLRDLVEEDLGIDPADDPNAASFVRWKPQRPARRPRPVARSAAPRGGVGGRG